MLMELNKLPAGIECVTRRAGIGNCILLYGEAGEVNKEVVEEMRKLSEKLPNYRPKHIYNEDEIGSIHQRLLNITCEPVLSTAS